MKSSFKIALGGIVTALSIVLMLLTGVFPFGTYAFPTFAGMFLIIIVIELGCRWALIVYAAVAALSLLFAADKEAALFYSAFLGFYPILKSAIERISSRVVQYVIKYAVFNACMVAAFYLGLYIFSIPKESFNLFGIYLPWVFLAIGNVFFVIYDICVSKMAAIYIAKYRRNFTNKTKM